MFTLTKNEIMLFTALCQESRPISELAISASLSLRTAYRLSGTLERYGLVHRRGERGARLEPGTTLQAVALKRFVLSEERPVEAIVGSKLLVLLSISSVPKTIAQVSRETNLKLETVRVLAWGLKGLGIVQQERNTLRISPTDTIMTQFLQDYSRGVNLTVMEEKTKVGVMLWSKGLEFIFKAPSLEDPEEVRRTGTKAMSEYGLDFISETNCYHFTYWHPCLRVEDIALHNLLIGPQDVRGISYSIMLLRKAGFDRQYLKEEARRVGMVKLVNEVVDTAEGKEVDRPFLPRREDMESLYVQYGVS